MKTRFLLPVGMAVQFIFVVFGGGMLISGLIAGFSLGWDMSGDDNRCRIALLLAIFGGILFLIGILVTVFLFKVVVLAGKEAAEGSSIAETASEKNDEIADDNSEGENKGESQCTDT